MGTGRSLQRFVPVLLVLSVLVPVGAAAVVLVPPQEQVDDEVSVEEHWAPGEELTDLRSEASATFMGDSPGMFRTELHSAERFFRDGVSGELVEFDANLVAREGGWGVAAAPSELAVPTAYGGDEDAVSLRVGGELVAMGFMQARTHDADTINSSDPVNDLAAHQASVDGVRVASGSRIMYEQVAPGVDVWVEPTRHGVKETLILEDASAPRVFEFWVETDLSPTLEPGGGVHLLDRGGAPVAVIPAPYMQDASEDAAGEGFSYDAAWEVLDADDGDRFGLRLTAGDNWLDDPERVWPVLLDPTLEPLDAALDDTYVNWNATKADRSGETVLKAGKGVVVFRSFIHFDAFDLSDKFIWNATLHLYQTGGTGGNYQYCVDDVASELEVRKVTSSWVGSSIQEWVNQPTYSSTSYGSFSQDCGELWASASVTDLAAEWAAGTSTNYGVALREPTGVTGRRDFRSMNAASNNPYLEVWWSDDVNRQLLSELHVGGGMTGNFETCADDALFGVPIDESVPEYVPVPLADLVDAVRACVVELVAGPRFAANAYEEDDTLTTGELDCLGDNFAALDADEIRLIVGAGVDPAVASDTTVQARFEELYTAECPGLVAPEGP